MEHRLTGEEPADPDAIKSAGQPPHMVEHLDAVGPSQVVEPEVRADEVFRILGESRKAAGNPPLNPFGVEENRRNLEAAIDCAYGQRMIPRRFSVEELLR